MALPSEHGQGRETHYRHAGGESVHAIHEVVEIYEPDHEQAAHRGDHRARQVEAQAGQLEPIDGEAVSDENARDRDVNYDPQRRMDVKEIVEK